MEVPVLYPYPSGNLEVGMVLIISVPEQITRSRVPGQRWRILIPSWNSEGATGTILLHHRLSLCPGLASMTDSILFRSRASPGAAMSTLYGPQLEEGATTPRGAKFATLRRFRRPVDFRLSYPQLGGKSLSLHTEGVPQRARDLMLRPPAACSGDACRTHNQRG